MELRALGDFEPSNRSVMLLAPNALREPLALPERTQGIELRSLGGTAGVWGNHLSEREPVPGEAWDVLLWPQSQPCPLWTQPGSMENATLTSSTKAQRALLHWGRAPATPAAVSLDLDQGTIQEVSLPAEIGHHAAAVAAGNSVLLLGGALERGVSRKLGLLADDGQSVELLSGELLRARAQHAALALSENQVLVAGGADADGNPIASVELLDGLTEATVTSREIAALAYPRLQPQLLPLGSDQVLVAGGFVQQPASGERQEVGPLEVLRVSGTGSVASNIVLEPLARDRSFASLGSGGVLALGGCQLSGSTNQCSACGPNSADCISPHVWWITTSGTPIPLAPLPETLRLGLPRLVAGIEGSAWLLSGSRIARFDPALAEFVVEHVLPNGESTAVASRGAAGLLLFLSDTAQETRLQGLRFSQRSRLSPDVAPLLLGSADNIAFHRPPQAPGFGAEWLRFDPASGLSLRGLGAGLTIAETDYAALSVELELDPGPLPQIVLWPVGGSIQQGEVFGGTECPWPRESDPERSRRATLSRDGTRVELRLQDTASGTFSAPNVCTGSLPSRVRVSVSATSLGTSQIRSMVIQRQSLGP